MDGTSVFSDFDALMTKLVSTADPVAELRLFVGDVRARERAATHGEAMGETGEATGDSRPMPSGAELRRLGCWRWPVLQRRAPPMRCVRLSTSGMPYSG